MTKESVVLNEVGKSGAINPVLEKIVKFAREVKLSDIHLHSDEPLSIRVHGEIEQQTEHMISKQQVAEFINSILDDEQKEHFKKHRDIDMAIPYEELRFRVNAYNTSNGPVEYFTDARPSLLNCGI